MNDSLETLEEKDGTIVVPDSRLQDANSARGLFEKMFEHDRASSADRARVQAMFDGEAPYTEDELKKQGLAFMCNVNFGEGEDLLLDALVPYIDMLQSVEVLMSLETSFGETKEERKRYAKEIAREITNMIRGNSVHYQRYLLKATYFVGGGVAFAPFFDHITWVYDVKRLGEFYVPRDADACEDAVPVAMCLDQMDVGQLYDKIRDEESAAAMGWNVEAVKKAIIYQFSKSGGKRTNQSWETWVTKAKTDDLYEAANCDQVELVRGWVREFDGSVTSIIFARQPGEGQNDAAKKANGKDFLFEKKNAYESMSQAFVSFTYGVGTSGKYYGVRSLGKRILAPVQVSNRMRGRHIDGSALAASEKIQPKSESDLGKALISVRGPYTYIHPNATVIPTQQNNFAQNTVPVIQDMSNLMRAKASGFTTSKALPDDGREMSQYEASARIANAAGLTATNQILFLKQEEKLLREQVRRIVAPGYPKNWEGGREIVKLLERLEKKGVPKEAFYGVDPDSVRITMPVGSGSAAARDNQYRRLRELGAAYDETGQRRLLRDQTANILGSYEQADEYVPDDETMRLPEGAKLAMLENFALADGKQVPVLSEEFHIAHLDQHTNYMLNVIDQVQNGQIPTLADAVGALATIHDHATQHLEYLSQNPITQADAARFRQVLQQSGEIIMNGMRQLEKEKREQAAQGGGEQQQGPDPKQAEFYAKLQRDMELHQFNMQKLADQAKLDVQIKLMKANADSQIADAKAASALSPFKSRPPQ